jgi:hypothetical protein
MSTGSTVEIWAKNTEKECYRSSSFMSKLQLVRIQRLSTRDSEISAH